MTIPSWTTPVLIGILIVGIVVLTALNDPIPATLSGLLLLLTGGHLALAQSTPTPPVLVPSLDPTSPPSGGVAS